MDIVKLTYKELNKLIEPDNLLSINREIKENHIASMAVSIGISGILRLPVIGKLLYDNDRLVVIDGQHLLSAVLDLDISKNGLEVIIKEYRNTREVINAISTLNSTQKAWNDDDYLNAWTKFDGDDSIYHDNYMYLAKQVEETGLSLGILITAYAKSNNKVKFKNGKFEFADQEFTDKVIRVCEKLKKEHKKSSYMLRGVVKWARRKHLGKKEEIDFGKLSERLTSAAEKDEDVLIKDRDNYAVFIEKVYNNI